MILYDTQGTVKNKYEYDSGMIVKQVECLPCSWLTLAHSLDLIWFPEHYQK